MAWLKGKKTFIVAGAGVVWAIGGLAMGWVEPEQAMMVILGSLGMAGLRDGMR